MPKMSNNVTIILFIYLLTRQQALTESPNIVIFLADDYGWNDVGYHGSEIKTPTLDKLASEGVKLENYFVQPLCTPTRSQLLSGRYQIHTGLQHGVLSPCQENGLPLEIPTIANKLKELGYATHAIGKWHIGYFKKEYLPTYRGFDTYFGYQNGMEDYYTREVCKEFSSEGTDYHFCGVDFLENDKPFNSSGDYSTSYFAKRAELVIENHAKYEAQKPLFLYLPFQSVHTPLEVPEEYILPYAHIQDINRRIFSGMVACMDEAIENITQALMKHNLWDNTVFIFSTDNGGQVHSGGNNWPLRGNKKTLWDGGVRGVGFVHSPLLEQKGVASMELMHVSDWFPTLVTLAGGDIRGLQLDGYDVWDSISKNWPSPRKELLHTIDPLTPLSGQPRPGSPFDTRVCAAIRVGQWKLITGNPGEGEWFPPPKFSRDPSNPDSVSSEVDVQNLWLFDVSVDPTEMNDLSTTRPDIVNSLLERLAHYNSTAVPVRFPNDDPDSDPSRHGGFWFPWVPGTP